MSGPHLLDTSTLSHYLGARAREKTPVLVKFVDDLIATEGTRISVVTLYELERWMKRLELKGEGKAKRRRFTMFMSAAAVYGLEASQLAGWMLAAEIHARAMEHAPSITFAEADLLILATAQLHRLTLVTSDRGLADNAHALGFAVARVELA
jgi:predicted nucleic acid-binding protein